MRDLAASPEEENSASTALLAVSDLRVEFAIPGGRLLRAVRGMMSAMHRRRRPLPARVHQTDGVRALCLA